MNLKKIKEKLDLSQFESSAFQKTLQKMNRYGTDWEKTFVKYISDKRFVFRIYKELLQHNNEKNYPIKQWAINRQKY